MKEAIITSLVFIALIVGSILLHNSDHTILAHICTGLAGIVLGSVAVAILAAPHIKED